MRWLIEKWDWFIYWMAMRSIKRICDRNIGHAYLMELSIRDYIAERGMPDSLRRSTELFHDAMKSDGDGRLWS